MRMTPWPELPAGSQPSVDTHAVVYARISHDAGLDDPDALEDGLGVKRQVDDCTALASSLGLTVVDTYADNDVSAAGRAKPRPQYEAMLSAVSPAEPTEDPVAAIDRDIEAARQANADGGLRSTDE